MAALFQSLLYEACGRVVNPVYGAVGLLFTGNWAVCQAAVETVLKGGSPKSVAMKPNSTLPFLDHPAGFNSTTEYAAFINKHTERLPSAHEFSLATPASSFKADSFHAAVNHCALNFSHYSASSSAEEMTTGSQFNKRSRDCKLDMIPDEHPVVKRPRSVDSASAVAAVADPHHEGQVLLARRPSITTWIEGFNKARSRRICSNDCMIIYDAYPPGGNPVVSDEAIKHAHHDVLGDASNGVAVQGAHEQVVVPVARRVYIPPHVKQELERDADVQKYGGLVSNGSTTGGEKHQAHVRSSTEDCVPSLSCSMHRDMMHYACRDAINVSLNLGMEPQQVGELYCNGELVNNSSPHDTLEHMKREEPHVLLRMSSPSVNSEGSVSTVNVGGLHRSSCTAFESPKDGLKLLDLLF